MPMEFLQLVIIYVTLFFTSVGIYFYRDARIFKNGLLGKLCAFTRLVITTVITQNVQDSIFNGMHYLFYTRNQCLKVLFGVLVFSGNIICIMDLLPLLYKYLPDQNHTLIPIVNAFLSLYFFHKCCNDDPGEITPQNLERYKAVYPYDGIMYVPNKKCRTCCFIKPARSKHCSICNRCVHRFDHHCLWTNNDVGGLNHGYFVLFLITMMFKCIWGFYVGLKALLLYTQHQKLFEATVMTSTGELKPVTFNIVIQHLFMHFPRVVFIVTSLFFLIILLGVFTIYHINIVLTNRTTNERYKTAELDQPHDQRSGSTGQKVQSDNKASYLYDKGILVNIYETFRHRSIVRKIKLK